jgi:hypothetical protein
LSTPAPKTSSIAPKTSAFARVLRWSIVACLWSPMVAAAHVAPAVDDNNRYITVTPFGDRIRVAYVVFFGEVPGAIERRIIDTDRDGQISNAESHAYAVAFGQQLAAALEAEVDATVTPFIWSSIEVGMGAPEVAAGTFSIDLVADLCLARPAAEGPARHRFTLRDRFRVAHPGETELKVEDAPGITIDLARVGATDDPGHDYRFAGPGGPLADPGLELELTAGSRAIVTADGSCAATPRGSSHGLAFALVGLGVAGLGVAGLGVWRYSRVRRPS